MNFRRSRIRSSRRESSLQPETFQNDNFYDMQETDSNADSRGEQADMQDDEADNDIDNNDGDYEADNDYIDVDDEVDHVDDFDGYDDTYEDAFDETLDRDEVDEEDDVQRSNLHQETPLEFVRLPQAREHSYLPGSTRPLLPVNPYSSLLEDDQTVMYNPFTKRPATANSATSDVFLLPVLELPGLVLFPGATLPIRLWDASWRTTLGAAIDASRLTNSRIEFGVLLRVEETDRRQSWTRQGYGPARLRRWSERLILELMQEQGGLDEDTIADAEADAVAVAPEPIIRAAYAGRAMAADAPRRARSLRETSSRTSLHNSSSSAAAAAANPMDRYNGRIGTIATILYTHGDNSSDALLASPVGRRAGNNPHNHANDDGELVITALGTGRFQIVSLAHDQDRPTPNTLNYNAYAHSQRVRWFNVRRVVDKPPTTSGPASILPCSRLTALQSNSSSSSSNTSPTIHSSSLVSLQWTHTLTPIPSFVMRQLWPQRLMETLWEDVENTPSLEGLRSSLYEWCSSESMANKSIEERRVISQRILSTRTPTEFSHWMASNMALTNDERLQLLEATSTVERLLILRQRIQQEKKTDSRIHCRVCTTPLSAASFLFTVGGASGTTGNYVNEHGAVHQTVTVREVCEPDIWYSGGPQTRDSWFPGYSWTIMSCGFCGGHLGWKFRRLRPETAANRPEYFYGLSAANIVTSPIQSSRRFSSRETVLND
jgi:ATP-dependent protease La (LON) substrate-binding domain/Yippee zinc-binding/DNA-binding /Mis18, centromere assembly